MQEHDLFERVMQVMDTCHQLRSFLTARSRELLGLSLPQLLLLARTDMLGGQILVSELATALSRTSHNVTALVNNLVKQGLVTRRRVPVGDRRHVRITITPEGTVKLRAFRRGIVSQFGRLVDEQERQRVDQAIELLRELLTDTFQRANDASGQHPHQES